MSPLTAHAGTLWVPILDFWLQFAHECRPFAAFVRSNTVEMTHNLGQFH